MSELNTSYKDYENEKYQYEILRNFTLLTTLKNLAKKLAINSQTEYNLIISVYSFKKLKKIECSDFSEWKRDMGDVQ